MINAQRMAGPFSNGLGVRPTTYLQSQQLDALARPAESQGGEKRPPYHEESNPAVSLYTPGTAY